MPTIDTAMPPLDVPAARQAVRAAHPTAVAANTPPSVVAKIDLCRGLFACLVVVAHAMEMAWLYNPPHLSQRAEHFLRVTCGAGIAWVMGFFVISGYCIELSAARLTRENRFPIKLYTVA